MSENQKKIGEIERLLFLIEQENISYEELAELSETSVRTVTNTIYDNKPIGMKLLRGLQKKKGVSLDWLLEGIGEMYVVHHSHYRQEVVNHGKESNVVTTGVNNGNIVAQAGKSSALGGRDVRICQFVRWWMDAHEPDDQAWFEKQLERAVPEYGAWKKSNR